MKTLKDRLKALLAQVKGIRLDVLLTRGAALCGVVAGGGALAGLVPGRTGAALAAACAVATALGPKMSEAAGVVRQAQDGQTPGVQVAAQIVQTLAAAPKIIAQAKADARDAAQAQAEVQAGADKAALVGEIAGQVADILSKTGQFRQTAQGLVDMGADALDTAAAVAATGGNQ